jgi:hypothetical protein
MQGEEAQGKSEPVVEPSPLVAVLASLLEAVLSSPLGPELSWWLLADDVAAWLLLADDVAAWLLLADEDSEGRGAVEVAAWLLLADDVAAWLLLADEDSEGRAVEEGDAPP